MESKNSTPQSPVDLIAKRLGVFAPPPTTVGKTPTPNQLQIEQSLMARRLGILYKNIPVNKDAIDEDVLNDGKEVLDPVLDSVVNQAALLEFNGGHLQQERMILDKRRSLDRAVIYSYQGANIKNIYASEDEKPVRALINPNKVKQDYDDKIVSVGYEYGFKPGHVFEWLGTGTHWIIYLQDLTELAYFRGQIRRCSYQIKWLNDSGELQNTYAAIRGPVETQIDAISKAGTSVDTPNYSLNFLIPKTKESLEYFRRYTKFYLQGTDEGSPIVCWRVKTADWISMKGVIEINAEEYFINPDTDEVGIIADQKVIENKVAKEQAETVMTLDLGPSIQGNTFIKPKITYTYTCDAPGQWKIEGNSKYPILIMSKSENEIKIKWDKFYSGEFKLIHGDAEKTIAVETLY